MSVAIIGGQEFQCISYNFMIIVISIIRLAVGFVYRFPECDQGARCSSVVMSVRSWCDGLSDRSFMVDPLSYFSFQPVLHDWCNKGCGMCYLVCGIMHIKKTLLLIRKSSPCGGSRFPLSLSEWSFTICLTPYNCK